MNNIAMLNINSMLALASPDKAEKATPRAIFERKTATLTALRKACVEYVAQHGRASASDLRCLCQELAPEVKSQPSTIVRPAVRQGILVVNSMPRKMDCFYTMGREW
jgi:hypothetical protein